MSAPGLPALADSLADWLQAWQQPAMLLQLGLLLLALALGAWLAKQIERRLRDYAPRVAGLAARVLLPLSLALSAAAAQAILVGFGWPSGLAGLALTLALTLAAVRALVYLLKAALRPGPLLASSEPLVAGTLWLLAALHLIGALPWLLETLDGPALKAGELRISLLGLIQAAVTLALLLLLSSVVARALERRLMEQQALSMTARIGVAKVLRFVLALVAVLVSLNTIGIDLTTLTVFSGALGVGIGFGLQRIASNFISGFILLMDRSIRQGDVITVGDSFGWVKELRARYVVIANRDGVELLIPNENLITSEVINWSYSDRLVRLKVPVQISYDDDPEQALALLVEVAKANPRVESSPAPVGRLMAFGDSGIDLELRVWIDDPEGGVNNIRSELLLGIWKAFREAGITIPYPQRDLHLKTAPELWSRLDRLEQRLARLDPDGDDGPRRGSSSPPQGPGVTGA